MSYSKNDFRKYINTDDMEKRATFLQGFLTAANAFGIPHPSSDLYEAEKWALNQAILYAFEQDEQQCTDARRIARHFTYNKQEFRNLIFRGTVNDNGDYIDECGHVTDHPVTDNARFVMVAPNGLEIDESIYQALSAEAQSECAKVRCIEAISIDAGMRLLVREDATWMLREMLVKDIRCGDPINKRYSQEILCKGGRLEHLCCGEVVAALMGDYATTARPEMISGRINPSPEELEATIAESKQKSRKFNAERCMDTQDWIRRIAAARRNPNPSPLQQKIIL